MSAYHWIFFAMHLVSNISQSGDIAETEPILSQSEDISENEPILSHSTTAGSSKDTQSSCEIRLVCSDVDCENSEAEEHCNLLTTEQPQCRICLDNGGEDLIAPCYCRGTQKYVHRSCLDNWRSTKMVAYACITYLYMVFLDVFVEECKAVFILRANVPPDRWWLRLKFQLLVVRDHLLIFVIVQLVVGFLGMLVYKFYGEELREMFGYEEHPYGFYSMAILAIVMVGLLYGFFIAIICGRRINERHFHVLAKQELTKEYVVESRDENKKMPGLDSSQVRELRMLGLY